MDGVEGAMARMTELRARFAVMAPATTATRPSPTVTAAPTTGFDQLLARETAAPATGTAPLTPAARLPAGQYPALQAPADLAAYGNGKIPLDRLTAIGTGQQLWAPAGAAFNQMAAAAKADGVTIEVNDSYRDYADQQRMAAEKGLYSQGGLAAAPGTSTHGWGVSLDLELDGRAQQWMRDNGAKHGFVEDVPREPWHWTYRPVS